MVDQLVGHLRLDSVRVKRDKRPAGPAGAALQRRLLVDAVYTADRSPSPRAYKQWRQRTHRELPGRLRGMTWIDIRVRRGSTTAGTSRYRGWYSITCGRWRRRGAPRGSPPSPDRVMYQRRSKTPTPRARGLSPVAPERRAQTPDYEKLAYSDWDDTGEGRSRGL
eukprot:TRINITY_DN4379_c0_g2_i1.p4 TRINITY_DN4379_c0_g2~~TRINITY_DN4379_c0_g2_i1.p4  ORF type:complete len:165 (+),score=16.60 TRINITY_DN4379_c0_g2_i1:680-1174(+)